MNFTGYILAVRQRGYILDFGDREKDLCPTTLSILHGGAVLLSPNSDPTVISEACERPN